VRAPARALALACLLAAAPLSAVEEPDFETAVREVEIELARRSFERMLHYAIRLKTVSEPIRADGASLCGDRLAPVLGLIVTDRWELPWATSRRPTAFRSTGARACSGSCPASPRTAPASAPAT